MNTLPICGIYKITSPSGRIYIGQSVNIYLRWWRYSRIKCEGQILLYNSIKKYGWENHKYEIIQGCRPEQLNELEKYYINLFQTFNSKYGLNLKNGGGQINRKHTPETGEKISLKNSKIILNTETGIFYGGVKRAAESIGMRESKLRIRLLVYTKNNTPFIYA